MSLLEPAALAWLGLVPVLLALYFMKLRRREAPIPAVFLWKRAAREARVDSFFQRLRVNLLLLLQLLALIGLALALGRPYVLSPGSVSEKLVLVLDVSASMQARSGASTRFELAREEALRLAREAPRGTEIMLVAAGRQARVLLPFTTDRTLALRGLRELEPEDAEGDLSVLRSLVVSIAGSHPRAEIFLLGDELSEGPLHPRMRFLGFGEAADNVAVTAFHLTPDRSRLLVFAAFESYSEQVQNLTARFLRGGREIRSRRIVLPAGSRRTVVFPVESDGPPDFEVSLAPDDALSRDNRAYAIAPRVEPLRVVLRGSTSRFLEKALLSIPEVRLFRHSDPSQGYDLEVCPQPPERPSAPVSILLAPPEDWIAGEPLEGALPLTAGGSPVVDGVPLQNLWVRRISPLQPPPGAQILLLAGERPALLLVRDRDGIRVVFAFDLYDSNLPLSPGFPILMARIATQLASGGRRALPAAVAAGHPVEFRADGPPQVVFPDGRAIELPRTEDGMALLETGRTGFYEVRTGESVERFAVNLFSRKESHLQPAPPGQEGGVDPTATEIRRESLAREYWWEMILAVLLVLLAEWYLYHRRRG
ncbi:MAG: BatA domain-containing protein [Armatimonadetes bacterium]|nr:BatA domain-containing protein [Armatimonadota bacterium]